METKTQSDKGMRILDQSDFDSIAMLEVNSFFGRIWTFWNSSKINIQMAAIYD